MEIDKKLRMMRFWLAGTVIIVIGMVSIVSYFLQQPGCASALHRAAEPFLGGVRGPV